MQDEFRLFVRKVGNVDRNYERMVNLDGSVPIPKIYKYIPGETLEMEYIRGLDIKNYLIHNKTNLERHNV